MLNIKQLRKELKLSQESLAKKLGVTSRTVQNWEAGKEIPSSSMSALEDLAKTVSIQTNGVGGQQGNNNTQFNMPCPDDASHIRDLEKEVERLRALLAHKEDIIKELRSSEKKQDARIEDLQKSVARLEKMNDHLMSMR